MKAHPVIRMLLLVGLAAATVALTQEKNPPAQNNYSYDTATQVTVTGRVSDARDYSCPVSGTVGAHIFVSTSSGEIEVHLAPARFMKQNEISIHTGDSVTVTGSRFSFEGKPALMAKSVIDDRDTYTFRDGKGRPLW
jgi:DNA/RNA endonuclease YhcR with UshA esterase domain